jgi:hypothetical protein
MSRHSTPFHFIVFFHSSIETSQFEKRGTPLPARSGQLINRWENAKQTASPAYRFHRNLHVFPVPRKKSMSLSMRFGGFFANQNLAPNRGRDHPYATSRHAEDIDNQSCLLASTIVWPREQCTSMNRMEPVDLMVKTEQRYSMVASQISNRYHCQHLSIPSHATEKWNLRIA